MARPLLHHRLSLLPLLTLAVGACDDDEPAVTEITTEQAEALTVAVWEQAYRVGAGVPIGFAEAGSPPIAAQTTDYQDETVVPCELAGSVTVESLPVRHGRHDADPIRGMT